jgi:hypothetical protein
LGCGPSSGGAGVLPPAFLPLAAVFSSRQLGAVLRRLPLKAFFGAGFKLGARLAFVLLAAIVIVLTLMFPEIQLQPPELLVGP